MPRRYQMPSLDRAVQVAGMLRRIRIDAAEEVRSCQAYLVVENVTSAVDDAVMRIEPQAKIQAPDPDPL